MAFNRRTALIVGAGASCEINFPDGRALLDQIAVALDIQRKADGMRGSFEILQAFKRHHAANNAQESVNAYVHAGWRLRDAARIARSIDNAMDQNSGDEKIELAGKLGITHEILRAEAQSLIASDPFAKKRRKGGTDYPPWLYYLGQMITTEMHVSKVESAFDNLDIITFNYDRSIEHYLPHALAAAYGLSSSDAQDVVRRNLRIHHVFGQVGTLSWMAETGRGIDFGEDPGNRLEAIAGGIQTFTESREPDADLQRLHDAMLSAAQIVFLGFGFHKLNMELLTPPRGLDGTEIFGTVFREPEPAINVATQRIKHLFAKDRRQTRINISLINEPCGEFLGSHYSVLTM